MRSLPATLFVAALLVGLLALPAACPASQVKPDDSATAPADPPAPALDGIFQSTCIEFENLDGTDGYLRHILDFDESSFTWKRTYFSDASCADSIGVLTTTGAWLVDGLSEVAGGGLLVQLQIGSHTVLPLVPGFVSFLQSAACGKSLKVDEETDVSEKGCPSLGLMPTGTCPVEYDFFSVRAEGLKVGRRGDEPPCSAEARPTQFGLTLLPQRS
jgi:hypothetical protein